MKTMSIELIKEIRKNMREISKSLKVIEEQETNQETATNNSSYDTANLKAGNEVYTIMNNLQVILNDATSIGCLHDAYTILTCHRITESLIK